jgi:hypothetical protein
MHVPSQQFFQAILVCRLKPAGSTARDHASQLAMDMAFGRFLQTSAGLGTLARVKLSRPRSGLGQYGELCGRAAREERCGTLRALEAVSKQKPLPKGAAADPTHPKYPSSSASSAIAFLQAGAPRARCQSTAAMLKPTAPVAHAQCWCKRTSMLTCQPVSAIGNEHLKQQKGILTTYLSGTESVGQVAISICDALAELLASWAAGPKCSRHLLQLLESAVGLLEGGPSLTFVPLPPSFCLSLFWTKGGPSRLSAHGRQ